MDAKRDWHEKSLYLSTSSPLRRGGLPSPSLSDVEGSAGVISGCCRQLLVVAHLGLKDLQDTNWYGSHFQGNGMQCNETTSRASECNAIQWNATWTLSFLLLCSCKGNYFQFWRMSSCCRVPGCSYHFTFGHSHEGVLHTRREWPITTPILLATWNVIMLQSARLYHFTFGAFYVKYTVAGHSHDGVIHTWTEWPIASPIHVNLLATLVQSVWN